MKNKIEFIFLVTTIIVINALSLNYLNLSISVIFLIAIFLICIKKKITQTFILSFVSSFLILFPMFLLSSSAIEKYNFKVIYQKEYKRQFVFTNNENMNIIINKNDIKETINYGHIYELECDGFKLKSEIYRQSNFKRFLLSNDIDYVCINNLKLVKKEERKDLKFKIFQSINDNYKYTSKYTKLLFFKYDSENIHELLRQKGLIHLFIVSGFHISLLGSIFRKMFKKFKFLKLNKILPSVLLTGIPFIFNLGISTFKAILSFLIGNFNVKEKASRIDIYCLLGFVFLVLNPFYLFNIGFILSFFLTYFIFKTNWIKNKFLKLIFLNVTLSFGSSIIMQNENYNIFSFINSFLFSPIAIIIFILSIISIFVPFMDFLSDHVFSAFDSLLVYLPNFTISLNIPFINSFSVILFFLMFFTFLVIMKKKKKKKK